jgi:hypothetical protein
MRVTFRKAEKRVQAAQGRANVLGLSPDTAWSWTAIDPKGQSVTTQSLEFVQRIINPDVQKFIADAQKVAASVADTLVDKFFNWIGHTFMGNDGPGELAEFGVIWKDLEPRYAAMKRGSGFWVNTGKLRRQFYARSGIKLLGQTELQAIAPTLDRTLYQGIKTPTNVFKLKLMPRLGTSVGNTTDLEDAITRLLSDEERRKLQGKRSYYRALLGPALVLFLRNYIPAAITEELARQGYKINATRQRVQTNGLGNEFGV